MRSKQLREKFYKFFTDLDHQKVISAPIIPAQDPTLLFTNAGMNQFKDYFLGKEKRNYNKAVSIQKCLRVSGKHNDFDEVGKTDHHHTFFEMMGNFSFGDYFKKEAIQYGWSFLTQDLNLPPEKLWVTVFREDDEAYNIWKDIIKVPEDRILRLDEKDNFWQMGDVGPCGPCSEIHYDRGDSFGKKDFINSPGRFIEIWNLVFMQFNRREDGTMTPLAKPSIDTGMGLERLTSIMQGVQSNYDTDLFLPIKQYVAELVGKNHLDPDLRIDLNIVADHARAITFLISDSILPSNDGRGYVLRRILRRAAKHGKSLGFREPFLSRICLKTIELMADFYPELEANKKLISRVVEAEEVRFNQTLSKGLGKFESIIKKIQTDKKNLIPGRDLFTLSDTYGFPLDFAADLANEYDLQIDYEGFDKALKIQRERSQKSQKINKNLSQFENLSLPKTQFTGYSRHSATAKILALFTSEKKEASLIREGETGIAIFDHTPFYAESGGQIADLGTGKGEQSYIEITDVQKVNNYFLHFFKVGKGCINLKEDLLLSIDPLHRLNISTHHTTTHILHWALRETLGLHVKQAGSHVSPDKLRFDFTHYAALDDDQIKQIEILVNQKIRENQKVTSDQLDYEVALSKGAIAIFDEKYSDLVRMITIGGFSKELCGGIHLEYSGQAGLFRIIEESSISAGIRRIEAKAGSAALHHSQKETSILRKLALHFKQKPEGLFHSLVNLETDNKNLRKKLNDVSSRPLNTNLDTITKNNLTIAGIPVTVSLVKETDKKQLGSLADLIKKKNGGVVILFSNFESKSLIIASVEQELSKTFSANDIIRSIGPLVDGRGGGKADFAQAGGCKIKDPDIFNKKVLDILQNLIENK